MSQPSRTKAEMLARFHLHAIIVISLEDRDALPGEVVKLAKRGVKLLDRRAPRARETGFGPSGSLGYSR